MKHTLWWVQGIYSNPRTFCPSSCTPPCLPPLCLAVPCYTGAVLGSISDRRHDSPLLCGLCLQTPNLENSDFLSIPYLQAPANLASAFLFHDLSYYSPRSRYFQRSQCTECILQLLKIWIRTLFSRIIRPLQKQSLSSFLLQIKYSLLKVNLDYLAKVDPNRFYQPTPVPIILSFFLTYLDLKLSF